MTAFVVSLALLTSMLVITNTASAQINIGVAGVPTVVNTYAPVTNISGTTVTVGASTGFSHPFAAGDKVLLVQMTGSTGVNGGKFEFADVTSVSGSNVTLSMLNNSYSFATEKVQLIWVPYDPIGITTLANILAKAWDGSTGGIVCVLTDGTLTLNGAVIADKKGFTGFESAGNHIWGEGVYGGGGAGSGGGGGYGANTMNAAGASADYDSGGGGGSTKGGGGAGGPTAPPAGFASSFGAGGSKHGAGGVNTPHAGGNGSPAGTAGSFAGGGGGGAFATAGGMGGKYGGGGSGGLGLQGGTTPTVATYNGGAVYTCDYSSAAGGGGGGVGGGGGGGGINHHSGAGGGGASPAKAGCGGSITNFGAGGMGAVNGVGATNGQRSSQQGFGVGHGGGGGGAYSGGGGGGGGFSYQENGGGGGGGFKPASGYHTFFSCDAGGTCTDPRMWMGGGAPSGGVGGGIVVLKANNMVTNNKPVTANGGNGSVPYGGGGGGMVIVNTQNTPTGSLDICAKGGDGAAGTPQSNGSSGGGGGGVIWVNNMATVVSNINPTGLLPTVPGMTFCIDAGAGGPSAPNPKDNTYGGGGGCGGGGVVQVNPNEAIFCASAILTYAVSTSNCNTFDVNLTITGGEAPYTIDWSDLPGSNDPEDRVGIPLGPGYYLVTVTTSQGCASQLTANVGGCDFGDTPDNDTPGTGSYPTNLTNGGEGVGPHHLIVDGLKLGQFVDNEPDGQPSAAGDGDGFDDDGVNMPMFIAGQTATVPVTLMNMTGQAATLVMFIDFTNDGDFGDSGEKLTTNVPNGATSASFNVPVPLTAMLNADIGVRFRLSKDAMGVMQPTGLLQSGEVEDYVVQVMGYDWGDLPDTGPGTSSGNYQTLDSDNGPSHKIVPGLHLGATIDAEPNGQPNATATGDGGDDDGITVPMFVAGLTTNVSVSVTNTTPNPAKLTGFFDWNKDGDFNDAGEMASVTVPAGTNGSVNFPVPVPENAIPNMNIGAFFRLSTNVAASMSPTGPAPDGEMESFIIQVTSYDWGDLPDTGPGTGTGNYETQNANNGSSHKIVTDPSGNVLLKIGARIDAEGDGQQNAGGTGDNNNPVGGLNDEDGVSFPALIITGMPATFPVTVMNMTGQAATLVGFFDWNNDGDFNDTNEKVSQNVPNGTNGIINLSVVPPLTSALNTGYGSLFRLSTDMAAAMSPTGPAPDGETESYVPISLGYDYADLPDTGAGTGPGNYQTLLSDNGPRHKIVTDANGNVTLKMGALVDDDADGQPGANAQNDDLVDTDDDDGIAVFPVMIVSQPVSIPVTVMNMTGGGATLYGFADFNNDGDFSDPSESFTAAVPDGTNGIISLNTTVPGNAVTGTDIGFLIRLTTATGVGPTGFVANGEVESAMVQVAGYDYGDLPNSYGTMDPTGAKHAVSPNLMLGDCSDAEIAGQPELMAGQMMGGDDNNTGVISFGACAFPDDENGIQFVTPLIAGNPACIKVTALNNTGSAAILQGWIDFNGDGDMLDAGEQLNTDDFAPNGAVIPNGGVNNQLFCFDVPANAIYQGGIASVRFRLTSAGGLQPNTGIALNGEIEDYRILLAKAGNLIWDDTNGNGIQNTGEPGINGTTVQLVWGGPNNIIGDGDDITYTTVSSNMGGMDGMYMFPGMLPGNYHISVPSNPVGGFISTVPNLGGNDAQDADPVGGVTFVVPTTFGLPLGENGLFDAPGATFPDGQDILTFEFGYYIPPTFNGLVFNDFNNNGIQDPGEFTIPEVTVSLTGTNGLSQPVTLTTTTNINGNYVFDNLVPGTYKLTFSTPPQFYITPQDQGGNDAFDSDVDPAMGGMTAVLTMNSGANLDIDIGYFSLDFGDLPQSYVTSGLATAPQHVLSPYLFLGAYVDAELDGQPGATASGDDGNSTVTVYGTPAGATDDEDGIVFATPLIPGNQACVKVTAANTTGTAAVLQAWVDFNGDGQFQASEQLNTGDFAPSGASIPNGGVIGQLFCFNVPATASYQSLGTAMARFRLSPTGGLLPNSGRALGGEIEESNVTLVKIGNIFVWNDENNDGLQNEPASKGLNGVTLQLVWAGPDNNLGTPGDNATYTVVTTTMNGVNGQNMFTGLIPGTYNLSIPVHPPGFIPSQLNQGPDESLDSENPAGIVIVVPAVPNFPLNENGTGDTPGQQFPDAQDDHTLDFAFVSVDHGDLPNSYGTNNAANGPKHAVNPILFMGASVDGELDGMPDLLAGGDDNNNGPYNVGGSGDDENGIVFETPLIPGFEACVRVTTTNLTGSNAVFQGWVDWNNDGDFADVDEQLNTVSFAAAAPGALVPIGTNVNLFCFDVPATATFNGGLTFARFRLSPTGGLASTGPSAMPFPIGEAEEARQMLTKSGNYVWIDANVNGIQDEAGVLGINNVPVQLEFAGPDGNLATAIDNRIYSNVSTAVGGINGKYLFTGLIPGNYRMSVPAFGYVPTLVIDIAGNTMDFIDSDNPAGVNFTVPNPPTTLPTGENGTGDAPLVLAAFPDNQSNFSFDFGFLGFDFGDLPDSYGTTQGANNPGPDGAVHVVNPDLYLGTCVDIDMDGQPETLAGLLTGGDDGNVGPGVLGTCAVAGDDEGGITFPTPLIPGNLACVKVTARNNTTGAGILQAWIDYNGNGIFEASEQLTTGNFAPAGATIPIGGVTGQNFCFDVPANATFDGGNLKALFRLRKATDGPLGPNGPAIPGGPFPTGEVESYGLPLAITNSYLWMDNPDIEGDQDASEMPLANVKVNLTYAGEDGIFQTAANSGTPAGDDRIYMVTTDANGYYEFRGLIPSTNYRVLPHKYTAPNGVAGASINPANKILTIPNLPPNDNFDSDPAPFIGVSIPNLTTLFLPTGENGLNDNVATGFPDNQANASIDIGFIDEPKINGAMAITGFDATVCGEFAVFMDLCIKNTSTAPLASIQAMLDLAGPNAYGAAFKGMIGTPILVSSTAQQVPVFNAGYTGAATAPGKNLFNGTSGLLWPGEQICIRIKFGVDPDIAGAPAFPKAQAMVSGKAQNFQGVPIPDYWNGGAQYMAMDLSDVGNDPLSTNPGYPGDTGGSDDPTVLGNCWQTTQTNTVCNDLVYISMDAECNAFVTPSMLLEGEDPNCDEDNYPLGGFHQVTITTLNTNQPVPNPIPASYFGQTLKYSVKHIMSCNSCWGNLKLEDKLPPEIECSDIHLNCVITNYTPDYLQNVLGLSNAYPEVFDCATHTLTHSDTWHDLACNEGFNYQNDLSAYVERIWTAKDAWNNVSTCTQYIYFHRIHVFDVHFPTDAEVSCTNGNSHPSVTGVPYYEAFGIQWPLWPNAGFCELATSYTDDPIVECDGTTKILRTWKAIDWCLPTSPTPPLSNPLYYIQVVKVVDHEGPAMTCPANLTVSTDPFTCCATVNLPDIILEDNCSRINNISGKVITHEFYTGEQTGIYTIDGIVQDFPGNNWWDRDTLGNYGWTPCLPVGTQTVIYTAQDDCGNTATCSFQLTVSDFVPPVAACDETTTVAIGPDDPLDCYTASDGCEFAGVT
ncbi:MAG: SdrD B-like domain-containing protein, partial [Saprospiraceae bacterium]